MKPITNALPLIAPAFKNEVLGSWLLRVASTYDLALPSLLTRIGAARHDRRRKQLLWMELNDADTDWEMLAQAVRRDADDLRDMSIARAVRHVPKEVALCETCLLQSVREIGWPVWKKDWLHSFAAVCTIHSCWLIPVPYSNIRGVRRIERLTEILMDRPEQQTRALDCPETLIAGAKWIHRTFVETSKPPPLKDDLADLDGSRLVHKLLAALERQADLQGIFERGDHRDRMRHLGLIGAYLKARASDQQTDTPKLFVTAIRELRKADAARKYLMDLIAPLFTPRVRSPH